MKNITLLAVLATLLVGGAAKSAASSDQVAYAPTDVKILGVLNYGQKSGPVEYSDTPQYRAFLFAGDRNDQVEVTVTGAAQNAFVALADQSLNVIATGTGHLSVALPDHGPDAEMFYVVFKDQTNRPARMSVQVTKTGGATVSTPVSSEATR
jgi:hypothetical protein